MHQLDGLGADPAPALGIHAGDIDAVEQDAARQGSEVEADAAQQLRLARSCAAEDGDHRPRGRHQAHTPARWGVVVAHPQIAHL